jgi:acyl-CoA reductase-like NAD-dependent aldehyde dehydrogenase
MARWVRLHLKVNNVDKGFSRLRQAHTLFHAAQVCSNGTRVLVQQSILEPFLDQLYRRMDAMKGGDPTYMSVRYLRRHRDAQKGAGSQCHHHHVDGLQQSRLLGAQINSHELHPEGSEG